MNTIGVDYDEFQKGTYRAVWLFRPDSMDPEVFNTGDPAIDFEAALIASAGQVVMCSSSVDHFISDDPDAAGRMADLRQPAGE